MTSFTVVVPTLGRPSLVGLLDRLTKATEVIVVDDRPGPVPPLQPPPGVRLLRTAGGTGPASARNLGWRAAGSEWVVFVDDDVRPSPTWLEDLQADLDHCGPTVAGCQGRVSVPFPDDRRPTDRERNVGGLSRAHWITADMAYRRTALARLGGFDGRFRRAYREDSDLALRAQDAGWDLVEGRRRVTHPVAPAPWWASIRDQRGNRDDVLMRRLHGPPWRERAGTGPGRTGRHLLTTSLLALTLLLAGCGRRRGASLAAAVWSGGVAAFAWERIRPGPRTAREILSMVATSAAIPPTAIFWRAVGLLSDRDTARRPAPSDRVEAVLFDRDGTLVVDIPYNHAPESVELMPGADHAVARLRAAGLRLAVVSNQSGVGRGLVNTDQVEMVNRRLGELVGGLEVVLYCTHVPEDGCSCRKPAPGMILEAAHRLGVEPPRCVVVGDILSDVLAAEAAGARAVLVPNGHTAAREVDAASHVAGDLEGAADLILGWSEE